MVQSVKCGRSDFEGLLRLYDLCESQFDNTDKGPSVLAHPDYLGLRLDDEGVWCVPVDPRAFTATELEALTWTPLWENPEGPSPLDNPALRFPFSAAQLAAFLLDGPGQLLADGSGDWADGPDEDFLQGLGGQYKGTKEVLRAAFRLLCTAQSQIGPLNVSQESDSNGEKRAWRRAMVRQLLPDMDSEADESVKSPTVQTRRKTPLPAELLREHQQRAGKGDKKATETLAKKYDVDKSYIRRLVREARGPSKGATLENVIAAGWHPRKPAGQ